MKIEDLQRRVKTEKKIATVRKVRGVYRWLTGYGKPPSTPHPTEDTNKWLWG
jgi:hypothetical protein